MQTLCEDVTPPPPVALLPVWAGAWGPPVSSRLPGPGGRRALLVSADGWGSLCLLGRCAETHLGPGLVLSLVLVRGDLAPVPEACDFLRPPGSPGTPACLWRACVSSCGLDVRAVDGGPEGALR